MKPAVRGTCVAIVAALALIVGVTAASAGEVRWFGACVDGTAETTAGPLTVSLGWATNSVARTQKFLDYQYVTYSVNGGASVVTSSGWGPITQVTDVNGNPAYVTRWTSPVLANLASGESATVNLSVKTTKTVWDDDKTSYKAGTELLGPYTTCTITAT